MLDNLFANLPPLNASDEVFTSLLSEPGLLVQRIVSSGQASPPDFWYEQPEAEWVLLISGEALLRFEDEADPVRLTPGAYIDIAAGRRHRVEWTTPESLTIWLVIHRPSH